MVLTVSSISFVGYQRTSLCTHCKKIVVVGIPWTSTGFSFTRVWLHPESETDERAPHLQVPVQLHIPGTTLQNPILPTLIDSGTADCFIDAATVRILQILLQCKAIPDLIET